MNNLRQTINDELTKGLMPFWNGLVDKDNGGFYGEVTFDLQVNKKADKGGIFTARLLWSYSRLFRYTGDETLTPYMGHLYDFFVDKIYDSIHKGIFWMVDYKGEPTDRRKHIYAQAFAIYALTEYGIATGKQEAFSLALEIFHLIESVGYDESHEGYLEEFTESWQLKDNEMLSENGVTAYFTMNTHLHILEAYTNLCKVHPGDGVKERLIHLIQLFKEKFYDKDQGILKVFLDEHWQSIIDLNSYGHDIEATWLIQEAIDISGYDDKDIDQMIQILGDNVAARALQEDGSIINEIEQGIVDKTRVWWGQSEAMVGFLNIFEKTGDSRYMGYVENLWAYTQANMKDKRDGGEWYWSIEADGSPTIRSVVEPWKTPYHNIRGCIEVVERLTRSYSKVM